MRGVDYDLIVTGGGIIGTCIAYFARKLQPNWSILLLEQGKVGGGASDFSAGFDAIESPNAEHRDLAIRGRLLYRSMSLDVPEAAVLPVLTHWVIDERRGETFLDNFRTNAADFSDISPVDPDGARLDIFRIGRAKRVLRDPNNGFARPGEVSRGIVRYLRGQSTNFACWEGVQVSWIENKADRSIVFLRDGRELSASHVFLAIGAWLADPWGATLAPQWPPVRTKKVGSLWIERAPEPSSSAVVFYEEAAFFLPVRKEGRWLFNFTLDAWDAPLTAPMCLDQRELDQGLQLLDGLAPGFVPLVSGAQVFCDAYTPDQMPLSYSPSSLPRVRVAGGCSGSGYRIGPAVACNALVQAHIPQALTRKEET